jgi:ArsR family transcriptional regulator
MAAKLRVMGEPTRLAGLRALMAGEKNVSQAVEETGRPLANLSKHLKQLAEAGLVARRKEGPHVFYRLDDPAVDTVCRLVWNSILKEMEEQLAARTASGRRSRHVATKPRSGFSRTQSAKQYAKTVFKFAEVLYDATTIITVNDVALPRLSE